jgi:hypothetical protein
MGSTRHGGFSTGHAMSADGVAELLGRLWAAGGAVAEELDRIGSSRTLVSAATVAGLEAALARLRPAVGLRAQLAHLDPGLLRAGTAIWAHRRGAAVGTAGTAAELAAESDGAR